MSEIWGLSLHSDVLLYGPWNIPVSPGSARPRNITEASLTGEEE